MPEMNEYCNYDAAAALGTPGKDILIAVWNKEGTKLLAVESQESLTVNRTKETTEKITKDGDGWSHPTPGNKSWSIDLAASAVPSGEAQQVLDRAYAEDLPVCVKIYDKKQVTDKTNPVGVGGLYAGLAYVTDLTMEAPADDAATASFTLTGIGKLRNLLIEPLTTE